MTRKEQQKWTKEAKERILAVCKSLIGKKKVSQGRIAKLAKVRDGLLSSYCAKYPEINNAVQAVRLPSAYEKTKAKLFKAISYFKARGQKATKEQVRRKAHRVSRASAYKCYKMCPALRQAYLEIMPEPQSSRCDRLIANALEKNVPVGRRHALALGLGLTSFYKRRNKNRDIRERIEKLNALASNISKIMVVAHYLRGRGETVWQYEFAFLARMTPAALSFHLRKENDFVRRIVQGVVHLCRMPRHSAERRRIRKIRLAVYQREIADLVMDSKRVAQILNCAA